MAWSDGHRGEPQHFNFRVQNRFQIHVAARSCIMHMLADSAKPAQYGDCAALRSLLGSSPE